jgi:hypothetical protein
MKLLERFFRDLSQQRILPGSFGRARQLFDAIMQYLAQNLFVSFCFFSHDTPGARHRENR